VYACVRARACVCVCVWGGSRLSYLLGFVISRDDWGSNSDPSVVQRVASRYTDHTIPAVCVCVSSSLSLFLSHMCLALLSAVMMKAVHSLLRNVSGLPEDYFVLEVGVQFHVPAALLPRTEPPSYHWIGCLDRRYGLDNMQKILARTRAGTLTPRLSSL
jgi:hypothetical protein